MEQLKRFLRDKGFALALLACLVAAAAAGVWAVRTVRDELKENLDGLNEPDSTSTLPGIDEDLTIIRRRNIPNGSSLLRPPQTVWPMSPRPTRPPKPGLRRRLLPRLGRRLALVRCANLRLARRILACQQFGSACFHAAHLWQSVERYSGDELVYNKTLGDWRTHNGIDYAAREGEAVPSPVDGSVVLAGADGSWGPVVAVKDSAGRIWRLCGVASPKVKEGDTVSAGQVLGTVGSVSCECAEESHLHLEVKQGDSYLDPAACRN